MVFAVAFAAAFARAGWLQAVRAEPLANMADGQHRWAVTIPAARGTIYDRNGVELAIGRQATTVYANPRHVVNPRRTAFTVAHALRLDVEDVYPKIADRSRGFVYLARKSDPRRAAALKRLGLAGIGFYPEERRAYPHGSVGAHVLGYAGLDNDGLAGVELSLDRTLRGSPGRETIVRDPFGRAIDVISSVPAREGRNVQLTLDHSLQAHAQGVLRETVSNWGAKSATAIVLEPTTGAILAMAVERGYDANRYPEAPRDQQRNRAVTDTYEPGSTFKVVTVAGALTDGLVRPQTSFTLPYEIQVADRKIRDSHDRATEQMTVDEIVKNSSNVGTITVARLLGESRLATWIDRFGFGRTTGLEFPGESPGIVLPAEEWSGSHIGTVPIGQGIAVTPVQMAAAYGAIANRGVWVRPHLVQRRGNTRIRRSGMRRVIPARVAGQLMTMMRGVVSDGTGTEAELVGYQVAGKTGTASKPDPDGGYSDSRYVASFVGVVPASAPRLVILVAVDEPRGAIWGGVVAAPAFQEIARFALQYLEIPPDAAVASSPDATSR